MNDLLIPSRPRFARLYYGLVLVFLVFRWKSHLLLSQLESPDLVYLGTDMTYILFAALGISKLLVQNYWVGWLFDVCLAGSAAISFLFPRQRKSSIVFTLLLGIYIVVGYSYLCFHKHNLTGMWFASLMFLVTAQQGFAILFKLTRWYALYVYASSGLWKIWRGVWDAKGHMSVMIKVDALPYLAECPDSLLAKIIYWLLAHPALLDASVISATMLQCAFIIGFFTRRLDWFFIAYALVFHTISLFLLHAYFLEFSLILIALLPLSFFYYQKIGVKPN